ncbi:hypothetical protein D3C87_125450 [compost metagenome]
MSKVKFDEKAAKEFALNHVSEEGEGYAQDVIAGARWQFQHTQAAYDAVVKERDELRVENDINKQAAENGHRRIQELEEILKEPLSAMAGIVDAMKKHQAKVLENKNDEIAKLKQENSILREICLSADILIDKSEPFALSPRSAQLKRYLTAVKALGGG